MILGILAILFCWIPFFGVVAWPLLIVSIVLGCVALPATRSGGQTGHGMAIAGLVCSGLALIVCALYVVFFFAVAGAMP
ncbi:hypothetical protein [Pseudonocardia sp. GCM10023141]|uniref:hypothetical protein n=1 Tax=Pseudonocardia sp. GCM10023141 TaxID=3252653 RepID=UPI00360F912C